MNISEWRRHARGTLRDVSDSPERDADLLLSHTLGRNTAWLRAHDEHRLTDAERAALDGELGQRRLGVPMAYLLGEQPFWTLSLRVTRDTLVPRPETEHLVEQALARLPAGCGCRVADLGTGSGAVALAIASERPEVEVVATDRSPAALRVAAENARRLGIGNVQFVAGDWFEPLAGRQFELIASNPPYVEAGFAGLATTLRYEPRSALASGEDGLDDIRRIATRAPAHLAPGGWLVLEHGNRQAAAVSGILRRAGFVDATTYPDLAGHDRITAARRD